MKNVLLCFIFFWDSIFFDCSAPSSSLQHSYRYIQKETKIPISRISHGISIRILTIWEFPIPVLPALAANFEHTCSKLTTKVDDLFIFSLGDAFFASCMSAHAQVLPSTNSTFFTFENWNEFFFDFAEFLEKYRKNKTLELNATAYRNYLLIWKMIM